MDVILPLYAMLLSLQAWFFLSRRGYTYVGVDVTSVGVFYLCERGYYIVGVVTPL